MKLTNTESGVEVDVPDKLAEQLIAAGTYAKVSAPPAPTSSSTRTKSPRSPRAKSAR